MSCPKCGGVQYALVSRGVAQCSTTVWLPTGAHPSGAFGPATFPTMCGYQYQVAISDGSASAYCACGMQAIARCVSCGKDLCLARTWRFADRVFCDADAAAAQHAAADRAEEAVKQAESRLLALLAEVPYRLSRRGPDLVLEHRVSQSRYDSGVGESDGLSREQFRRLVVGAPCPTHIHGCRIVQIPRFHWWQRPTMAYC